ncbi:unnamed protein product [Closterium sp. NIES-53]
MSGDSVRLIVRSSPPLVLYEIGSSLYTLTTEPPQVAASAQVSASGQVAASCSCRLLSHQTLLWHHRLGHPSLPRLLGKHSRLLVFGLPRTLPPLLPSPAPPCLPCVEGRQHAAPHSSSFPLTIAPLLTLHMDVKGQVVDVLIPWIHTVHLQLRERFGQDLPVLRLHSDRGGEFSSDLLQDFCRGEGILQLFTLPDSPHQNGIAERRIGLVMDLARTSMIHAAAPRFLWPFAVGDASVFRVWGSRAFVRDTSADKLSARAIPCVFLGFVPDAPGWQFYHPTSRRVFPSQDVMFDESIPFYRLFPYRSAPPPPLPLFLAPGPPPVDPLPPKGLAPSGVSHADPLPDSAPFEVAVGSVAARGAASGGADLAVAESEGDGSWGAEPGGEEPGGAEPGAEPRRAALSGAPAGASPRLSLQHLREWLVRRAHRRSARTRGAGAAGSGDVGGTRARDPTEPGAAGAGGSCAAVDPGAGGAGGTVRTPRRVLRSRPPPVPGTHAMALCPSSVPLRVPLPTPPKSSLPEVPDPEHDRARAASPTVSRLLATAVTDPSFECAAVSALVAELLDFAAACRLDYATALVEESASASPPTVGVECALGTDVLEDKLEDFECLAAAVPRFASMLLAPEGDPDAPDISTPRSYEEAITGPYSSQWEAAMDVEMTSWNSTGTYGVDNFHTFSPTPKMTTLWVLLHVAAQRDYELHSLDFSTAFLHGSLHEEMTTLAALGFAPSTADPSLFLRTDISLPPFYVLVYVLQRFGFQFSSPQPTPLSTRHSLSAPPSDESVEPSGPYPEIVGCLMYVMTCTRPDLTYPLSLLAHYVAPGRHGKVHWDAAKRALRYLCSTSGMGLVLGGRGPVVLIGHADASWVDDSATQRSSKGFTFSLGSGSVSWRSTCSSSVLSSTCEAEIYAGAMAAQELRWLTYLLTELGEQPRSPPVPYVDNKAMIALCQEHRLEHRMKHIALRYFLARELQQGGQLRLAYVATRANTADVFTKALPPGDHHCFSTVLGLVPTLPHLLTA